MKINWLENPLKLTFFCNAYAFIGWFYLVFYMWLFVELQILNAQNSTGGGGIIFAYILVAATQPLLSAACLGLLLLEILFKHKMNNKFVKENKIYNVFFYVGFVFNTIMLLLITYIYFKH